MPSLTYHGYACWTLEDENLRIVIDPGGFWHAFGQPPVGIANAVCLTHLDPDHTNGLPHLFPEPPGLLLAPKKTDARWDFREGVASVGDWTITPVPLAHRFRPWVPHRGYLFEKTLPSKTIRILHLGDGNQLQESAIDSLASVDILLLTVGGFFANPWEGARLARILNPRRVHPMHNYFHWQAKCFTRLVPEAEIPIREKKSPLE